MKINRATKIFLLLPLTFLVTYVTWYFIVMRDDFHYFFVFKHVLDSGPDYAPSIIFGLTMMSFVALWLIIAAVAMVIWIRKRRQRRAV